MKLLIIGGGPGGNAAALQAAKLGAQVTLVEKARLGGTCLNVGCIPTKVLLHATELFHELQHVNEMGLTIKEAALDFKRLQTYKHQIMDRLREGVSEHMESSQVEILYGTATLTDPHHAKVTMLDGNEVIVEFDKLILATGSEVSRIPLPGADTDCVVISDDALAFEEPPKSMIIIGGGVIGVEFAAMYSRLGTRLTIIEALDRILPNMDIELSTIVKEKLQDSGVKIYTSSRVLSIEETTDGAKVKFLNDNGELITVAEKVLLAVGRRPFTQGIGLEQVQIVTERGAIQVNEYMRTNLDHIYAIGDCTGGMMLAHVSSEQGRIAAQNAILGDQLKFDAKTTPSCVYLEPEFAAVGLTEEQARHEYDHVKVGKTYLSENAKVMLMGKSGLVKVVADGDTGKVLGLHILGPRASDMIHEGALAIKMNATIEDILQTIHAHPTIGEAVGVASRNVCK